MGADKRRFETIAVRGVPDEVPAPVEALEARVAALEGGTHGVACASGAAAAELLLRLPDAGQHVLCADDVSPEMRAVLEGWKRRGGDCSFARARDVGAFAAAMRPSTRLLWVQTPSETALDTCDIAALASVAHERGALLAVDNTLLTPYFQKPLSLGADLVLHSSAAFLSGDVRLPAGLLATQRDPVHARLRAGAGAEPAAVDAAVLLRGLETLNLRMERMQVTASRFVEFLLEHPAVERVLWPGVPDLPQHALNRRQASGFGGVLAFVLRGGLGAAQAFLEGLRLVTAAESAGGNRTRVTHPATMTHAAVPPEVRRAAGIEDGLVRLSVGLENTLDVFEDLAQALARVP